MTFLGASFGQILLAPMGSSLPGLHMIDPSLDPPSISAEFFWPTCLGGLKKSDQKFSPFQAILGRYFSFVHNKTPPLSPPSTPAEIFRHTRLEGGGKKCQVILSTFFSLERTHKKSTRKGQGGFPQFLFYPKSYFLVTFAFY